MRAEVRENTDTVPIRIRILCTLCLTASAGYGVSVLDQLKRHSVAIISLVVAMSSLGYNTWRNERTEANRNVRTAAFEVLQALGELQIIADHAHYDHDHQQGNPITGWGRVAMIRDLSTLISPPANSAAVALHSAWQDNWELLGSDEHGIDAITTAIMKTRDEVLNSLSALN